MRDVARRVMQMMVMYMCSMCNFCVPTFLRCSASV